MFLVAVLGAGGPKFESPLRIPYSLFALFYLGHAMPVSKVTKASDGVQYNMLKNFEGHVW